MDGVASVHPCRGMCDSETELPSVGYHTDRWAAAMQTTVEDKQSGHVVSAINCYFMCQVRARVHMPVIVTCVSHALREHAIY